MQRISTRNLSALPSIDRVKSLLQSLAVLDAILSPQWERRFYSFNAHWSECEQLGSMRNGTGDDFFALFNPAGCLLKGFAHESAMTPYRTQPPKVWPGMFEGVPNEFAPALSEPAFSMSDVTFCIWSRYGDDAWSHGPIDFPGGEDPDGSCDLLSILDGRPESYARFAATYYESSMPLESVRYVYRHQPLTEAILSTLNANVTLDLLADDLAEIGYATKNG